MPALAARGFNRLEREIGGAGRNYPHKAVGREAEDVGYRRRGSDGEATTTRAGSRAAATRSLSPSSYSRPLYGITIAFALS
jgi:hypothetical protein